MNGNRGKFITLEGVEGCGKSTQANWLVTFLRRQNIDVVLTKEPGGTPIGAQIRKILLHPENSDMDARCETLLYLADRAQHVAQRIVPNLNRGIWVVSDRYHDSTIAYQGAARGVSASDLNPIFQMATGGLKPDFTLVLDLDPQIALARAKARNRQARVDDVEGRFERERLAFHEKVRQGFIALARREPERVFLIPADGSVMQVHRSIEVWMRERGLNLDV